MTNSRFYPPGLLPHIIERQRLFELLSSALAENRAIWVAGPPGAGKTTLMAAYIRYHQVPYLWYQLDSVDGEPAAFFQYLASAAEVLVPGSADKLPRLTPEYACGLPAFTRRFSEILFQHLPPSCLLIFDNYQELPTDSPVYALFSHMLGDARQNQNFVFISREAPPPQLARLQINRQLRTLGWNEIRFTPEECDEFLELDGGIDKAAAREIKQAANGWIAGLILMKKAGGSPPVGNAFYADYQLIFDYFALEIVRHLPEDIYLLLRSVSVFKLFTTKMSARLCDMEESRVAEVLEGLHAQQFFIGRDRGDSPHYQLHPLFRHYLLSECGRRIGRADFRELQRRAAALAVEDGQIDDAAKLMLECGDWEQLADLCLANAQQLLRAGRNKSLFNWMERLPAVLRERNPWLTLWHGCAQIPYEPGEALEKFENAYRAFKTGDDVMGRYMAWACAVDCLNFAWDSFAAAPFWLGEFEELQSLAPRLPPQLESRVAPALLNLLIWAEGGVSRFPNVTGRCYELLEEVNDPSSEASLASAILYFHTCVSGNARMAEALVASMHSKIAQGAAIPAAKLYWYALCVTHCVSLGKYAEGEETMEQGLRLLEDSGARVLESAFLCQIAVTYIARKDLKNTDALLKRVGKALITGRRIEKILYLFIRAGRHLLVDDVRAVHAASTEGYDLAVTTAAMAPQTFHANLLCYTHLRSNEPQQARKYLDFMHAIAAKSGNATYRFQAMLLECRFAKHAGDIAGLQRALTETFQYAKRNEIINVPQHPHLIEDLCRDALYYGIEPDYVVKIIRTMQFRPANDEDFHSDWPWFIRIATLGGLRVDVGGKPLMLSKKQRRVLELLMLLIVSHREPLPKERIKNIVWPDADSGKAEQNFRSTLTRLRKLLTHDAVLWKNTAVSLNKKIIWVDYWEMESQLRRLNSGNTDIGEPAAGTCARIFELYRGWLLPGENHPWLLVCREQLHKRYCSVLLEAAKKHLDNGNPDAALSILNQALEMDSTVEGFYQLQIQALIRKGLYAEAVKSYQSCASILSGQLKILPSAKTKKIFESIPRT